MVLEDGRSHSFPAVMTPLVVPNDESISMVMTALVEHSGFVATVGPLTVQLVVAEYSSRLSSIEGVATEEDVEAQMWVGPRSLSIARL